MEDTSGQLLVFAPRVLIPLTPTLSLSGGLYTGKIRLTRLGGDVGELHRLQGPSFGGVYRALDMGDWGCEASLFLDALWLRVDVDVNSKTTEYAQGTRRYSGGPKLGSRLMLAAN
ncbi:MAG: hypothetical protein HRU09_19105 [Oligoflexales bacterium]|nr:hypothetical protein [Oligoflexales bacterium]